MNSTTQKRGPSFAEFVVIVSLMMSLTAMSIDAMLPALQDIGRELGVQDPNDRQMVVSVIFWGLAVGQLFFGPLSDRLGRKPAIYAGYVIYISGALSDRLGRKPAIYAGYVIYISGALLAAFAGSFPMLLAGRVLQGLGASAPRAVTMALVRDQYSGRRMAQVMSFVMTVFILVPMIAPTMGQAVLNFSDWRGIFISFVLIALTTWVLFGLRIPETLAEEHRAPFSLRRIFDALLEIVRNRTAIGYTVSAGLVGGAFLGYLNSSQQIFQEQYGLGERFPLFFAVIASAIGLASLLNSRLVMRFGMRFLVRWALRVIFALTVIGFGIAWLNGGHPPLWLMMAYLMLSFFCVGILFGNQNSLAMEPLGHLAGIGAAVVGSLGTFIQTPLGTVIGGRYDGTVLPLMAGLGLLGLASIVVVEWTEWRKDDGK